MANANWGRRTYYIIDISLFVQGDTKLKRTMKPKSDSIHLQILTILFLAWFISIAEAKSSPSFFSRQHVVIPKTKISTKASPRSEECSFPFTLEDRGSRFRKKDSLSFAFDVRGGGVDTPTLNEAKGIGFFILVELAVGKMLKAHKIRFPAQLAGCVVLFAFLILVQLVSPGSGDALCNYLSPGAAFLSKWMGVFFVPGLTMLPLAPSVGSSVEIFKTLGVVVLGFFYSLFTVTFAVLGVRKFLGSVSETDSAVAPTPGATATVATKPYSAEALDFFVKGTVFSAALSIAASKTNQSFQKPLETAFLGFVTLTSYVWGARLPSSITKVFNPLITSAVATLLAVYLNGVATDSTSFTDGLRSYTSKSLHPMKTGAGDLLLFLLSPSVISFAIGMYKGKNLIASNLPAILTAVLTGSIGSMFGTAGFARLINLGGSKGAVLRLATVPRSVQTALGMIIAEMLGGDVAIAATAIILTGIFGGMVGVKTLDAWGVKDKVSCGLGIGSAGLSLGVVSIKAEQEAFAFAGLCLVLTAVASTCLASIPAVATLLIQIAGGTPAEAAAAS